VHTIGIDYTPAYEQGAGIGRLVRDLVAALSEEDTRTSYRMFVSGIHSSVKLPSLPSNFEWRVTGLSPQWLARIWHRLRLPVPIELFIGRVDLFHATDFVLPPTLPGTKTILTVHDLSFLRVPETASPRLRRYLERVVPRSVYQTDHVIADSQATKDDLMEYYGIKSDKVTVLLSGIHPSYKPVDNAVRLMTMRRKYAIPDISYILSVGTVQPRKNYSRMIQALRQLRDQGYSHHLVIAGGKGWLEDEMYRVIEETDMSDRVHLIGFVDDEDLPSLYSAADCIGFPSLYEGFGFPILEGMACGTPVVTSNRSSLPEVAGDAALLVNPFDTNEIAAAFRRILSEETLRKHLITSGFEQVKKFTWKQSAQELRQIYQQVLSH